MRFKLAWLVTTVTICAIMGVGFWLFPSRSVSDKLADPYLFNSVIGRAEADGKQQILAQSVSKLSNATSENAAPTLKHIAGCSLTPPAGCHIIHVAINCTGFNETRSAALLIKSILIYRKNPIHFHLLVNKVSSTTFAELFRTWKLVGVQHALYLESDIRSPDGDGKEAGIDPRGHIFRNEQKELASSYDWLLQVLPRNIERVIALDAHRIFCTDIQELWMLFSAFSPLQCLGGVKQAAGVKPGVMMVDLVKTRLALADFQPNDDPLAGPVGGAKVSSLHALARDPQNRLFALPCGWNYFLSDSHDECQAGPADIRVIEVSDSLLPKNFWKPFLKAAHYDGNMLRRPLAYTCFANDLEFSYSAAQSPEFKLVETYGDDLCKDYIREVVDVFRTHVFYLDSEYHPPADVLDVTLVTQLSISRIQGFEGLCAKWPGPISVAVYLADSDVRHLFSYIRGSKVLSKRKNIGYHLVYEEGSLYPTNHLRNVAVKQVQTTHVFLLDVDFMPQPDLYERLKMALHKPELASQKLVLLVPAFETLDYRFVFPKNKKELVAQYDNGTVFGFRTNIFAKGHAATNFSRWRTDDEPYKITWEDGFEPYIVMKTGDVPMYNEIFMGYGKDKISQIMEVTAIGHAFLVLPDTYIIHLPHAVSFDSQRFRGDSSILKCMSLLLDDFTRGLLQKYGTNSLGGWSPKSMPKLPA